MTPSILVLNAGSSSIKIALYDGINLAAICSGELEGIGHCARFVLTGAADADFEGRIGTASVTGTLDAITAWLLDALPQGFPDIHIVAAGHRVVHGGQAYADPVLVDPTVVAALERLIPLAPNHQPHNLAPIVAISRRWPDMPQFACFDTAFHRTQPRIAQLFASPRRLADEGILRYGFHGLSYEYISGILPEFAGIVRLPGNPRNRIAGGGSRRNRRCRLYRWHRRAFGCHTWGNLRRTWLAWHCPRSRSQ